MRTPSNAIPKGISILLLPFLLISLCLPAFSAGKKKLLPATAEEESLYRAMSGNFLCYAAKGDLDFEKSLSAAVATFVGVIESKHGSKLATISKKDSIPLKNLKNGASLQLAIWASKYCGEYVPKDIQEQTKNIIIQLDKEASKKKR